ncbi:MAG: VWA domain-containing protein [Gammaproteobacteria bacterium]
MARHRRATEGLGLSFLDAIFCAFGAIVLLSVIVKGVEPQVLERTTEDLQATESRLQRELVAIRGETAALRRDLVSRQTQLAEERARVARLQGDLSTVEGRFAAAKDMSAVQNILQGKLAAARQALTEEMRRLASQVGSSGRDKRVGGIPVDSEYIIFVIDTSGSMYEYAWSLLAQKITETLAIYPRVKGIQVMNDMGTYMFSQYARKWIPDTPARRKAIVSRLQSWHPFSNSSPVEGIQASIQGFYATDKKISIYVFGDEFTGGSIDAVVSAVDSLNSADATGNRRVRIHAVGFPVQFSRPEPLQVTGIRFATLMRILAQRNGGAFVGLNGLRP